MNKAASATPVSLLFKACALSGALAVAFAHGFVCDKTFHFQSGYEVILSGKTTATLTQESRKNLDKSMGGATILDDFTEYEIFTDFDGAKACDNWNGTTIDMAYRKTGDKVMGKKEVTNHFTKLNSGNYPGVDSIPLDYWFGFTASNVGNAISIYSIIGKSKNESKLHVWYGNATMKKEILQAGVGTVLKTMTYRFPTLNNHVDSADLEGILNSGWKTEKDNDTQRVSFKLQLVKVYYDSVPSPVGITRAANPKPSAFQANQVGNLVLIQTGEWKSGPSEPLGLFNMMGQKVAVLHPTGYAYQWNGKTAVGADAPTGVYFVQSGSRILGKFFYSR